MSISAKPQRMNLNASIPLCPHSINTSICHFTNLVEEEIIDVISEESSELALLGLAWPHVHLYLLNEPEQNKETQQQRRINNITPAVN